MSVHIPDLSVQIVDGSALYAALRAEVAFSGSELNLEGAAVLDDTRVILLQRGNGAARGALEPVNASVEIALSELLEFVARGGHRSGSTALGDHPVRARHDRGCTFDASPTPSLAAAICFSSRRRKPHPTRCATGRFLGSRSGSSSPPGPCAGRGSLTQDGAPFMAKTEGLLLDRILENRAFAVIDTDDPERATELVGIELQGILKRGKTADHGLAVATVRSSTQNDCATGEPSPMYGNIAN